MKISENLVPAGKILRVISCNFNCTNENLRQAISFPHEAVPAFYQNAFPCDEIALVATCNRVEIYSLVSAGTPFFEAEFLAKRAGVSAEIILKNAQQFEGLAAIEHLCAVAAGLESQMIGEIEIFGQIKDAYEIAANAKKTGRALNKIFQKCFHFAKWLRTNTAIAQGQVSVGNVAVSLAQRIFGDLSRSSVFVAGTGEVGRKVAQAFANRDAGTLVIASRNFENARSLAAEIGPCVSVAELKNFAEQLKRVDIVIGALSVPEPVLRSREVAEILRSRDGRPLFFIDLGMPQNFESALADLPDVWLYTLENLAEIANKNLAARKAELELCRHEIRSRVEKNFAKVES